MVSRSRACILDAGLWQPLHTTLLSHTGSVRAVPIDSGIPAANSHAAGPELAPPAGAHMDIGHLPANFDGAGRHAIVAKPMTVAGLACNHFVSFSKQLLNERVARVSTGGGEPREPSTATFPVCGTRAFSTHDSPLQDCEGTTEF